jgi:hypothetical protein
VSVASLLQEVGAQLQESSDRRLDAEERQFLVSLIGMNLFARVISSCR